jgi:hypothetical protein
MRQYTSLALPLCLLASSACSGDDPKANAVPNNDVAIVNNSNTGDDFIGSGALGPNGEPLGEGGASSGTDGCSPPQSETECVGETYAGESLPLDIYIMFDQSGSMLTRVEPVEGQPCPDSGCPTRLDAIREATTQFLGDPASAGIGVGLGYFGQQPFGQASCDGADYESAAVSIGTLPEHGTALLESLNGIQPTGETPTGAAIRGACSYAGAWKQSSVGHEVVILLLTDGKPEAPFTCQGGGGPCCPTLSDAVEAAEECRSGTGAIKTYVLGVGPLLGNLEEIAVAGGTERAYLVEGGDVTGQVLNALNRIRGDAAIPCQLQLPHPPEGQTLRYDQVNLSYADFACVDTTFYSVQSGAECGTEDGWYYDDPSNPTTIQLCPQSCDRVSAPGGNLFYSVGCATEFRIK